MDLPKPVVVLFGAGATRAAFEKNDLPPPLDIDFFEIAGRIKGRGTGKLAPTVTKYVHDLYQRVAGVGLEEFYRDIETRYLLGGFAKTASRPTDWQRRKDDLEELIRRVIIHTTCTMDDGEVATPIVSKLHQKIISRLTPQDTIITFNYDTVIEEAIPKTGALWNPKTGYGVQVSGIAHDWARHWLRDRNLDSSNKSHIEILKLHGSINWTLYKTKNIRLKHRPYTVRTRNSRPVFEQIAFLPPGWRKKVEVNPYKTLWALARRRLEQCRSLVIVGYSLPETDLIAKALFLEVNRVKRRNGTFLKELHTAEINESTQKRLVELFLPGLGPYGLVYRYKSMEALVREWDR